MSLLVLVHGGGGSGWDWHRVAPELTAAGHDVLAPDLPVEDPAAGLAEHADAVVDAVRAAGHGDAPVHVVCHSLGAYTGPLVCDRLAVASLVLLAPMVPAPGESPADWWAATGQGDAQREHAEAHGLSPDPGPDELFLHDVPPDLAAEAMARSRDPQALPFGQPFPLERWPDVPTTVLACRDDRIFPLPFQRRLARERLGVEVEVVPGGHYAALSRPVEVAAAVAVAAGAAARRSGTG